MAPTRIRRCWGSPTMVGIILAVLILLICFSGADAKTIHVNESGWWADGFNKSETSLGDALKNASAGDVIVIYSDGNVSGAFVPISEQLLKEIKPKEVKPAEVLLQNWWGVLSLILVPATLAFVYILRMGYRADRSLSRGEMRRAMAGGFVVGIHALLAVSIIFDVARNLVVGAYLGSISSVMGFYFGSRTVQQQQTQSGLEIENVEFKDGKVVVSVRNKGFDVLVDAVYVDNKHFEVRQEIPSGSVRHIELDFDWEAGRSYEVKVCTSDFKAEGKFVAGKSGSDFEEGKEKEEKGKEEKEGERR